MTFDELVELAGNPETSLDNLFYLHRYKSPEIHRALAANPSTPFEVLSFLAEDDDFDVVESVAKNPNTAAKDLAYIAHRDDTLDFTRVLVAVARNSKTPVFELRMFYNIGIGKLCFRDALASNPSTPADILVALSRDPEVIIRNHVSCNPNIPVEALLGMSGDDSCFVRVNVARNLRTPVDVLDILSKDSDTGVLKAVAGNPNISVKTLSQLSGNVNYEVREAVAGNPNTSFEDLVNLSDDIEESVIYSVAKNVHTPTEVLDKLVRISNKALRYGELIRIAVANNPNTSSETLVMLSNDSCESVSLGAFSNFYKHLNGNIEDIVSGYLQSSGDEKSVKEFCSALQQTGLSEERIAELFSQTEVFRLNIKQSDTQVREQKKGKGIA